MDQRKGEAELAAPIGDRSLQVASDSGESEAEEKECANLWQCAPGSPEAWLQDWEGRQDTHDMFKHSYE
ncbi:hypothetical protein KIH86_19655 [Paenibacillus sp. HN-1]|uniref:hypothetical protein n=1 Tax=Paenibacillus TaxID=44249 RepID=UPI001CA84F21|nr:MULTISPECIES: hypothetical protein [Paenibacillus]MBY9082196.1 hypothetical protein [Paenibacillus sp. CGMCC 1.18879]MBY9086426.1 hypothetical protein [Paenibacillus sinensis]